MSPMPGERKRRHHHRSRNGCITCKQRHKRCDEGKPFCRNCMENGGTCGYRNNSTSSEGALNSSSLMVVPPDHLSTFLSATPADPFHTLPVTLCPGSQLLLNHFQNYRMFVRGLVKRNPVDGMFDLAISDAALLHASLVLSASHWLLIGGQKGITTSTIYHHKVEALRVVNERMNDPSEAIRDGTMGAVACLTILETTIGSADIATLHMNGLHRLVELRGGLRGRVNGRSLPRLIQRLIQLADLATASATHKTPRFHPRILPAGGTPELKHTSKAGWQQPHPLGSKTDPNLWLDLDGLDPDVSKMMVDLNRLTCYMAELDNAPSTVDQSEVWEELRQTEGYIESLMHDTKSRTKTHSPKRRPSIIAGYIYFYMNFRALHISSTVLNFAVTVLRQELESLQARKTDQFRPELLFWILFVGGCATSGQPERYWFRRQLSLVSEKLGILTWTDAKLTMSKLAWAEDSYPSQQKLLWDEVFNLGSQELGSLVVCERPVRSMSC